MVCEGPGPGVDAGTADAAEDLAVAAAMAMTSMVAAESESADTVSGEPRFFSRTRRRSNFFDILRPLSISRRKMLLLDLDSGVDMSGWRPPPPGRPDRGKFLATSEEPAAVAISSALGVDLVDAALWLDATEDLAMEIFLAMRRSFDHSAADRGRLPFIMVGGLAGSDTKRNDTHHVCFVTFWANGCCVF